MLLPKSLHTVSVVVNVATSLAHDYERRGYVAPQPALLVREALMMLGYHGADDSHGLVDVAVRKVARARA